MGYLKLSVTMNIGGQEIQISVSELRKLYEEIGAELTGLQLAPPASPASITVDAPLGCRNAPLRIQGILSDWTQG